MRKMMKKAIALGLIATMSMSAATIVHAEDEVTLRVLNWGNSDEEKIANDAIARFNEENPNVKVEQTCVPVESRSDFIQKWITMCTSGEAPDVISLDLEAVYWYRLMTSLQMMKNLRLRKISMRHLYLKALL